MGSGRGRITMTKNGPAWRAQLPLRRVLRPGWNRALHSETAGQRISAHIFETTGVNRQAAN